MLVQRQRQGWQGYFLNGKKRKENEDVGKAGTMCGAKASGKKKPEAGRVGAEGGRLLQRLQARAIPVGGSMVPSSKLLEPTLERSLCQQDLQGSFLQEQQGEFLQPAFVGFEVIL